MIYNFQAMRALAALLVTFVHIDIFVAASGVTHRDLAFGNVGVDLFFVLSGFVIVHSTAKSNPAAGEFMTSRITRVVPIYWLLTFGVFTVAFIAPQLLNSTTRDPMDLLKSLLFIPYLKDNGLVQPVLFVGWTLNYEMFFYAIFALCLLFLRRSLTATVVCTSSFIIVFTVVVQTFRPESVVLRFFGYPIVLEFVMGMWVAMVARRWPNQISPFAWPALFVGAFWLLFHLFFIPDAPRWLFAGIPSAAILWAALMLERDHNALSNRTVQLLGAASYALYLSHPFVLQAAGKLFQRLDAPELGFLAAFIAIVVAHLIGIAIHLLVERPMVNWLKTRISNRAVTVPKSASPAPTDH